MPPSHDVTQPPTVVSQPPVDGDATIGAAVLAVGNRPCVAGYEILGVLGRGGMGVVYHARQTALKREVALKMILSGAHASAADLARFRSEAQAIAALRHPNIVQVYEVGEHDGRPFFSLEYMGGGSLAERLDGTPQPPRASACLVEILARAMQTAHEHGIVHRDLKPGNILLAGGEPSNARESRVESGEPNGFRLSALDSPLTAVKISDFGLAKRLDDDSSQTRTGAVVGTPSYMAPEQAAGSKQIGPVADVYALGAILYDLLTGRPPFRGENQLETLIQVSTVEPVPPRRLQPKVPRDLETICLKCLEKKPHRRYASAAALADDLARFLSDRPIQARPVGSVERVIKWTRRKPALAALVVVSAMAALSLLAGGIYYTARLDQELERTNAAKATAEANARDAAGKKALADHNAKRAARHFRQARAAVDQMLTRIAQGEFANLPQVEALREAILSDALRYYEDFLKEKGDDPEVRQEAGRAYRRIGDIELLLNKHAAAGTAYGQAIALQQKLAADFPSQGAYRRELATTFHQRGKLRAALGEADRAEADYAQAHALRNQLVADFPEKADYRRELASLCNSLGELLQENGQLEDAGRAFGEAHDLLKTPANGDPLRRRELAGTLTNLGALYQDRAERTKAELAYRNALELYKELYQEDPAKPEYRLEMARSHLRLGLLLRPPHKPKGSREEKMAQEADTQFQAATALCTKLVQDFPRVPKYRQELAHAYLAHSILHRRLDKVDQANETSLKALEIRQKLVIDYQGVPRYREDLVHSMNNLAAVLRDAGNLDEARKHFDSALTVARELVETHPKVPAYRSTLANTLDHIAKLLNRADQLPEARRFATDAIEMQRSALALNPKQPIYRRLLVNNYHDLADTLIRMNELDAAAAAAEQIPSIFPKHLDGYFRATRILCRCSNVARRARQAEQARTLADRAMAVLQAARSAGLKDSEALRRENFKALEGRADYQQLLNTLATRKK